MSAKCDLKHLFSPVAVLYQGLGKLVSRVLGHKSQRNTFPVPCAGVSERPCGSGQSSHCRLGRCHWHSQENQMKRVRFLPKQLFGRALCVTVSLICCVSMDCRAGCELPWNVEVGAPGELQPWLDGQHPD